MIQRALRGLRPCSGTRSVLLLTAVALLAGCKGYTLDGKVVNGPSPAVHVLDADDPRFGGPGLEGAIIEITIDPESIRPNTLSPEVTLGDGEFSIPIRETGAGLLEYDLEVVGHRQGYVNLWQTIPLPGDHKRLLIVMTPGQGGYRPDRTFLRDTIRMGEELQRK